MISPTQAQRDLVKKLHLETLRIAKRLAGDKAEQEEEDLRKLHYAESLRDHFKEMRRPTKKRGYRS